MWAAKQLLTETTFHQPTKNWKHKCIEKIYSGNLRVKEWIITWNYWPKLLPDSILSTYFSKFSCGGMPPNPPRRSVLCTLFVYPKVTIFVTGFWKISLNVTFYNSNIYSQNEEWELPINLKVVTICISQLESPENNWKHCEKFSNFFLWSHYCVIISISMWH